MASAAARPQVTPDIHWGLEMIDVRDVTMTFGRTVALDSIHLVIEPGVTGLFGQNGSGKTTLLRAIAGLARPKLGTITVLGVDPSRAGEGFRRGLGYAGHSSGLYARLTLRENLEFFAHMYEAAKSSVDRTIAQLGLGEHADKPVADLSAGNKRRAAVARALLHDPRVLLLDEPYANVDDEAADLISASVKAWRDDPSKICIVATHGAKRVKPYADAGIILQRGHVVKHGTYAGTSA